MIEEEQRNYAGEITTDDEKSPTTSDEYFSATLCHETKQSGTRQLG